MRDISIYETDTSLLVVNRILHSANALDMEPDPFLASVMSEGKKEDYTKSIKFNVFHGRLIVTVNTVYAGALITDRVRQVSSSRVIPHMPGKIAGYLLPENIPVISAFLNKHFPQVPCRPLNQYEIDEVGVLHFLDSHKRLPKGSPGRVKIESMSDLTPPEEIFGPEVKNELGKLIAHIASIAFPVYDYFQVSRLNDDFYNAGYLQNDYLRNYHYASNLREFLTALFGVYRKDLARVAVNNSMVQLYWAANFANILDMESIIEALANMTNYIAHDFFDMQILEEFPRKVKKSLLQDVGFADSGLVLDALDMAPWIPANERKKCLDWQELHDKGMVHYSIDVKEFGEIKPPDDLNSFFEQAEFENLTVSPLLDVEYFIDTGHEMQVCVGSMPYIESSVNGQGYCFRLDNSSGKAEVLTEVIRVPHAGSDVWTVKQVRGVQNAMVSQHMHDKITEELSKYVTLQNTTHRR